MGQIDKYVTEATGSSIVGKGSEVAGRVAARAALPLLMGRGRDQRGWYRDSYRHSLAARGIKTTYRMGSSGVKQTPEFIVKQEVVASTKIPREWYISKMGYTGDNIVNDRYLYEMWSVTFKRNRDGEMARYYYIIKAINKGNDQFGDPVVEDRVDSYNEAVGWMAENKHGEVHRGERP